MTKVHVSLFSLSKLKDFLGLGFSGHNVNISIFFLHQKVTDFSFVVIILNGWNNLNR